MDCSCTVSMDLDDRVDLITINVIKARKEHTCNECSWAIKSGEEYIREVYVWDNRIQTHKTCEDCYAIRQVFFSDGWEYSNVIEQMAQFVYDCGGEVSIPCLLMLTPRARSIVCDMIEDTWR